MRTECQFLGNEISVRVFDLLFFLHSSIVSLSSPSEELRNHVYFKRKKHRNSPSFRGVISVGESSKEKFFLF